jgi:hypothetical protein
MRSGLALAVLLVLITPTLGYGSSEEPATVSRSPSPVECPNPGPLRADEVAPYLAVWAPGEPSSETEAAGLWVGAVPSSDADAYRIWESYPNYVSSGTALPLDPRIERFVQTMLAQWPEDVPVECADSIPWIDGPLIENANGFMLEFDLAPNEAGDAAFDFAVRTAREQGLVAFDVLARKLEK